MPAFRRPLVVSAIATPEPALLATYAVLGASAAGFILTFAVAPRFKDSFKEPLDWKQIYAGLVKQGGVKTVSVQEAYDKTRRGAVLLDVRLSNKYEAGHPAGAVSVPLYNPIQNWDFASNIRRAGFAFFGIFGTELNENFGEDALAALPRNKDIYVCCEMGGSLDNKPGTSTGFQSRSLKAVYLLRQAGFKRLYHVKGGLIDWSSKGLPYEADGDEEEEAGASKGKAGAVLGGLFGRR